ncbi:MAG: hypothetical protein AVDCRST_MAG85-4158 [uncultured Solirubrobacteraceae bacterium]|uniref:Uncharacterized protein n=1 Tax=uncultured Solirubrobacteraceae bacterium TaxID=1162706 RepID=A0A6J4TZC3_9ACTN|nr:MAG: hypothetical protein AVDCRST_MAG85-4158 [uncultured Solirubrobacteraceae bacterium]
MLPGLEALVEVTVADAADRRRAVAERHDAPVGADDDRLQVVDADRGSVRCRGQERVRVVEGLRARDEVDLHRQVPGILGRSRGGEQVGARQVERRRSEMAELARRASDGLERMQLQQPRALLDRELGEPRDRRPRRRRDRVDDAERQPRITRGGHRVERAVVRRLRVRG